MALTAVPLNRFLDSHYRLYVNKAPRGAPEEIQKPNCTYCSYNSNLDPPYIQMAGTEKFSHMVILDLLSNCNPFLRNYLIQEIEKAHIEKGLYCFFQEQHLLPPDR